MLTHILTGGFLAGYRTYVLGALLAIQALASWALGDLTLAELIGKAPEILSGLGLMTLRAAVPKVPPNVVRLLPLLFAAGLVAGCASVMPATPRESLAAAEIALAGLVREVNALRAAEQLTPAEVDDARSAAIAARASLDAAHVALAGGRSIDSMIDAAQAFTRRLFVLSERKRGAPQ